MTPVQEAQAQELIKKHLTLSGQTLDALRRAGLTEEQQVPIEFFFIAPNEKVAKALASHLEESDCLNLSCEKTGGLLSRKWRLSGQTYPTQIDVQVLAQWLPWIVVQGASYDCQFDGWGAEV